MPFGSCAFRGRHESISRIAELKGKRIATSIRLSPRWRKRGFVPGVSDCHVNVSICSGPDIVVDRRAGFDEIDLSPQGRGRERSEAGEGRRELQLNLRNLLIPSFSPAG